MSPMFLMTRTDLSRVGQDETGPCMFANPIEVVKVTAVSKIASVMNDTHNNVFLYSMTTWHISLY